MWRDVVLDHAALLVVLGPLLCRVPVCNVVSNKSMYSAHTAIMNAVPTPEFICWSAEFSTGVAELDVDHRLLLDLLNQLAAAIASGEHELIEAALAVLEHQILEHFVREESWFEQESYAKAEQHRQEHAEFHREIALQLAELHQNSRSLKSVALFVHDWLLRHLRGYDHHFADGLN